MNSVLVFDIGKTNVKLSVFDAGGAIVETLRDPNHAHPGPPYGHFDLARRETWLLAAIRRLAARHPIDTIVTTSHGSAGVLVDAAGPVMPMMDYEATIPAEIDADYRRRIDPFPARGSAVLPGAAHLARQMFWLARAWPQAFARAEAFLAQPQYWAWRLTGVWASEHTMLGAQSQLRDVLAGRPTRLADQENFSRLLPPLRPAWEPLGTLRPELRRQFGLSSEIRVLCGMHDSSGNFYRYQAAGMAGVTVISTGTWIVGLTDAFDPARLDERRGMTVNADVFGRPLAGVLAMGGRDFAAITGGDSTGGDSTGGDPTGGDPQGPAEAAVIAALIARGSMALPSFSEDDGTFPGSGGRGRLIGPPPENAAARRSLAVLHGALLTHACLDALKGDGPAGKVILDGSFLSDPLYAPLVAALRPADVVLTSAEPNGTAVGAGLLARHGAEAPCALAPVIALDRPGLAHYAAEWAARAAAPA